MTTTQPKPTTTPEIGGIGHSVKRIEDDRFTAGQGNYLDDHTLPGMLHMAILRSTGRPRAHQEHRHVGGGGDGRRGRGGHRRAARHLQPRVDAHAVGRHPGGAGHRQGAVPGPGGGGRRRHRPLHRRGRAGAHRRRLRDPPRHHHAAAVAGRRRGADPRRQGRPDQQPGVRVGERRRGRDRRRVRQGRPGRDAGDVLPALAPVAAGDVRHPRRRQLGERAGDDLHDVAGAARAPHGVRDGGGAAGAEHPDHQPRHRRRLRQQGAGVPGVRGGDGGVAGDRQAGEVGGEPHREPHLDRLRPRLPHEGRAGAHQRGAHPGPAGRDAVGPGRVLRRRATDAVQGRAVPRGHRQLRLPRRAREDAGRVHQQGTRRRRLPLLVPHHRGVVPDRAPGADGGVRAGHRSRRDAVQELHPARAVPVHDADRVRVRLRRLPRRAAQGARRGRLRRAARGAAAGARGGTAGRHRARALHRGGRARGRRRSTTSSGSR